MTAAIRDSLAQVQELLGRATPGPWSYSKRNDTEAPASIVSGMDAGMAYAVAMCPRYRGDDWQQDAEAIIAAIAWLREHIPALLAMMEHHSPDAGKMLDDRSAELTTAWMAGAESVRDRAAEAWRPIESAPRDGRTVILGSLGVKSYTGRWHDVTWVDERGLSRGPTHWRPLPAPPSDDAARAGERG